jgi:hypothetical protein
MQLLDADKKAIKDALGEISNSLTRNEAERDFIKEVLNDLHQKFQIPKKTLSKMAKVYHKQNFNEEVALNDEFETLYQTLTNEAAE